MSYTRHDPHTQQLRVLRAVYAYLEQHQIPPTFREIGAATRINSSSMVRVALVQLEMRGMLEIARAENGMMAARGLRITPKGRAAAQTNHEKELIAE